MINSKLDQNLRQKSHNFLIKTSVLIQFVVHIYSVFKIFMDLQ